MSEPRSGVSWLPFVVVLAVALLVGLHVHDAEGQAPGQENTYKLGHMFAAGSLPDQAANRFAELVAERTGGRVRVVVYPSGQLGDERENVAQLRTGILHFAVTGDVVVSNIGDKYRIVNMPFIYRDANHALRTYDSELGRTIRGNMQAEGIEALSWHYVGTRVLTANRPVRNLAELKGLELRLPQDSAWVTTWQALGARVRNVPFTELAAALAAGKVEAQENPPNFIRSSRLNEHQKYLMTTNHMPQRQMILASRSLWSRLPEAQRAQVLAAAKEASAGITRRAETDQQRDLEWLVGPGGMVRIDFDATGVEQAIAPVPAMLAGPDGDQILQQIRQLR